MSDDAETPHPWVNTETGKFRKGNAGRPTNARNKLKDAFLKDLLSSWEVDGPQVLERLKAKNPGDYVRVIASVLPKEVKVERNDAEDLSDGELDRQLRQLAAYIAGEAAALDLAGGEEEASGEEPAGPVQTLQ